VSKRLLRDYLQDILDTIDAIEEFVDGVDFLAFSQNTEKVFAVSRAFEIIGEAVKQIPDEIRSQYSDIPWRDIAGMRDNLIHGYFKTDLKVIWKAAKEEIPQLRLTICRVIENLEE